LNENDILTGKLQLYNKQIDIFLIITDIGICDIS